MRDDLHRTVPLPRPWRAVLRIACRKADFERVPAAISKAVRLEVEAGIGAKWATGLKNILERVGSDMFAYDRVSAALDRLERNGVTPLQRQLCEAARGLYARDGASAGHFERVLAEVCSQNLSSSIEHVVSKVREIHGLGEAAQVRKRLTLLSRDCSFGAETKRSRMGAKQPTVADLLNEPIRLTL